MRQQPPPIVVADTSVASDNLGDQIIMRAFWRELGPTLATRPVFTVPTHAPLGYRGHRILANAGLALVGGTNLLPARPHPRQLWRVRPLPAEQRKFVLVGCGFGGPPSRVAATALRTVLRPDALHSCRDDRTADFLTSNGFDAINTGCVTTWSPGPAPSPERAATAVLILNRSLRQDHADTKIVEATRASYASVRVWLQAPRDEAYLDMPALRGCDLLVGGLDALEQAIGEGADVVTTRLHAALWSIRLGARTTLFALDDRTRMTTAPVDVDAAPPPSDVDAAAAVIARPGHQITPRRQQIDTWTTWLRSTLGMTS